MSGKTAEVSINKTGSDAPIVLNLLEEKQNGPVAQELKAYEIRTIGFDR